MKRIQKKLETLLAKAKLNGLNDVQIALSIIDIIEPILQDKEDRIKDLLAKLPKINHSLIEELYEVYPHKTADNLIARGLKGYTLEQLETIYVKSINNDEDKHNEIKSLVSWADKNKLIIFGFAQFVISSDFIRLEKEFKKYRASSDLI